MSCYWENNALILETINVNKSHLNKYAHTFIHLNHTEPSCLVLLFSLFVVFFILAPPWLIFYWSQITLLHPNTHMHWLMSEVRVHISVKNKNYDLKDASRKSRSVTQETNRGEVPIFCNNSWRRSTWCFRGFIIFLNENVQKSRHVKTHLIKVCNS